MLSLRRGYLSLCSDGDLWNGNRLDPNEQTPQKARDALVLNKSITGGAFLNLCPYLADRKGEAVTLQRNERPRMAREKTTKHCEHVERETSDEAVDFVCV
ncbi:unnamed protein product [Lampetra fluviatilis]